MAAIGQKGLPVIDWNVRLYARIALCCGFISANAKGGNDETRSHHNRNCGHFGSDRLGGGGECTIWRSGSSLQRWPSPWGFSNKWPLLEGMPGEPTAAPPVLLKALALPHSPLALVRRPIALLRKHMCQRRPGPGPVGVVRSAGAEQARR